MIHTAVVCKSIFMNWLSWLLLYIEIVQYLLFHRGARMRQVQSRICDMVNLPGRRQRTSRPVALDGRRLIIVTLWNRFQWNQGGVVLCVCLAGCCWQWLWLKDWCEFGVHRCLFCAQLSFRRCLDESVQLLLFKTIKSRIVMHQNVDNGFLEEKGRTWHGVRCYGLIANGLMYFTERCEGEGGGPEQC